MPGMILGYTRLLGGKNIQNNMLNCSICKELYHFFYTWSHFWVVYCNPRLYIKWGLKTLHEILWAQCSRAGITKKSQQTRARGAEIFPQQWWSTTEELLNEAEWGHLGILPKSSSMLHPSSLTIIHQPPLWRVLVLIIQPFTVKKS